MNSNDLISIKDAAGQLNVSEITIKRYIKAETLESVKIGGSRRIVDQSLKRLLNQSIHVDEDEKKGAHFYWSQKNANVARRIYRENVKPGAVIMDPFLGGGSSLYGMRNLPYKFVGVEINEHPIKIAQFNAKTLTQKRLELLQTKLDELVSKYAKIYAIKAKDGRILTLSKVLFHKSTNGYAVADEVICLDKDNKVVTSKDLPELLDWYAAQYKTYKTKIKTCEDADLHHNSRIALKAGTKMSDLFSPMNFYILDKIKHDVAGDDDFKFVLGSVLHLIKLTDKKSQSQFPYWIPSKEILDRNIFMQLQKKLNQLKISKKLAEIPLAKSFKALGKMESGCLLIQKPIQHLTIADVPDNSVDFILTDPPYYDQVAYSEYLLLWQFYLGYKANLRDEIVVSQRKDDPKTEANYLDDLRKSFEIIHSKLKMDGQIWMYFKDSRPDKVAKFLKLMSAAGFALLESEVVATKTYTYKQNTSQETTVAGDMIYKFAKTLRAVSTGQDEITEVSEQLEPDHLKHLIKTYAITHSPFTLAQLLHSDFMVRLYSGSHMNDIKGSKQIVRVFNELCEYDKSTRKYSYTFEKRNELIVGDALAVLRALPDASLDACITDPPYNISGYDHKKKIGWLSSNDYWTGNKAFFKIDAAWDKFTDADYLQFTREWLIEVKRVLKPNGNIAIFGSFHNIYKIGYLLEELDLKIINSLVWYKPNAFPNITQRMFCESTEHIIWATNGSKKKATNWTFNYHVMKEINGGKQMRNMFNFPTTGPSEKKLGKHPSQKPVIILDYLVKALTNENDIVIDPFLGSGTTAIAAQKNMRKYIGIDSSYDYIKLAQARLDDTSSQQTLGIDG